MDFGHAGRSQVILCTGCWALIPLNEGDASDWQVIDAHHVLLRSERLGTANGRTYTITITATDASGNASTETVTVAVPHDMSAKWTTGKPANRGRQNVLVLPNPTQLYFTPAGVSKAIYFIALRWLCNRATFPFKKCTDVTFYSR